MSTAHRPVEHDSGVLSVPGTVRGCITYRIGVELSRSRWGM
jgi:hypothetical protein